MSDLPIEHVRRAWLWSGVAFVVAAAVLSLVIGPVTIAPHRVLLELADHVPLVRVHSGLDATQAAIVWKIRAPRVALGLLVGAMLALAGGSYQGAFRNPLADPYLLGAAAGAGLGATVVIVSGLGRGGQYGPVQAAAFAGAIGAVALTYALGRTAGGHGHETASLILAGVAVTSFLTAVQTYLQQRHAETIREVYSWILGRLTSATWRDVLVLLPYVVVTGAVLLAHRRVLDVMAVGDDEAATLGVPINRMRMIIVVAATLGTAAAVSVSGLIVFVGIIVPHTIRLLFGRTYRSILPLSVLFGAGFLALADLLARTVLSPAEVPIGVVTAFFGAPFFLVVLRVNRSAR